MRSPPPPSLSLLPWITHQAFLLVPRLGQDVLEIAEILFPELDLLLDAAQGGRVEAGNDGVRRLPGPLVRGHEKVELVGFAIALAQGPDGRAHGVGLLHAPGGDADGGVGDDRVLGLLHVPLALRVADKDDALGQDAQVGRGGGGRGGVEAGVKGTGRPGVRRGGGPGEEAGVVDPACGHGRRPGG